MHDEDSVKNQPVKMFVSSLSQVRWIDALPVSRLSQSTNDVPLLPV